MRSIWSKPIRPSDASSSSAADCSGQNSHHSLLEITASARGQPASRKSSPKSTSE